MYYVPDIVLGFEDTGMSRINTWSLAGLSLRLKWKIQLKPKIDLPLHKNLKSPVQYSDGSSL